MHDSGHDLLLATGPTKVSFIILTETRVIEKGPAIHPLFSNLDGLLRNDTVFHVQIIWHFYFTDFFAINCWKLRIHLDPIWEEGIDRCRKGLEIDHGVILDVNVKVVF